MYVYFDVDERSLLRYLRMRAEETRESAPGSLRRSGHRYAFVQLADEKDFPHEGMLDFAASEVNSSTGTARLRGVFANKDRSLASGLFVRVRVPASAPYQALADSRARFGHRPEHQVCLRCRQRRHRQLGRNVELGDAAAATCGS